MCSLSLSHFQKMSDFIMFIFILKMSLEFVVLFTILWVIFDTIYQYCLIPHYRRKITRLKPSSFFWHIYHTLPYLLAQWIEDKKVMNSKNMVLCYFLVNKALAKLWP